MTARCPICRAPVAPDAPARPFCSTRCKDVDLGRWLGEAYTISRPLEADDLANLDADEPPLEH